jgi:hypothetical protein
MPAHGAKPDASAEGGEASPYVDTFIEQLVRIESEHGQWLSSDDMMPSILRTTLPRDSGPWSIALPPFPGERSLSESPSPDPLGIPYVPPPENPPLPLPAPQPFSRHGSFLDPGQGATTSAGPRGALPPRPPRLSSSSSSSPSPSPPARGPGLQRAASESSGGGGRRRLAAQDLLAAIPEVPGPIRGLPRGLPTFMRSRSLFPPAPLSRGLTQEQSHHHHQQSGLGPAFQRSQSAPPMFRSSPSPLGMGMGMGMGLSFLAMGPGGQFVEVPFAELDAAGRREYRQRSILRWREKKGRRKAARGIQYSERSILANKRQRVSGRFVKQTTSFVSVTEVGRAGPAASAGKGAARGRGRGGKARLLAGKGEDDDDEDEEEEEEADDDDEDEEEGGGDEEGGDDDGGGAPPPMEPPARAIKA